MTLTSTMILNSSKLNKYTLTFKFCFIRHCPDKYKYINHLLGNL